MIDRLNLICLWITAIVVMMMVKVGRAIKPSHIPFSVEIDLSLECSYGNHMPCLFFYFTLIRLSSSIIILLHVDAAHDCFLGSWRNAR